MTAINFIYDGSFEGFLTTVFEVYEKRVDNASISTQENHKATFFDISEVVITDGDKSDRVWKKLIQISNSQTISTIYRAFLSEKPKIEDDLLYLIRKIFSSKVPKEIVKDFSDSIILKIAKVVKMVNREKHRMDAFVRFKLTLDGIYTAMIEPDFNVLPLNSIHFKNRYADQKWLIYDIKRNYGIFYDLIEIQTVEIEFFNNIAIDNLSKQYLCEDEEAFQVLWQQYFNSTNIASRKNLSLHIKHVPKRYWKYLVEKRGA